MMNVIRNLTAVTQDATAALLNATKGRRLTTIQALVAQRLANEHEAAEEFPASSVVSAAVDTVILAVADEFEATDPRFDRGEFLYRARLGFSPSEDETLFAWG